MRDVVGLELDYHDEYRDEVFCSQQHAALWLGNPLPPIPQALQVGGPSYAPWDWVGVALAAGLLGILSLALYGAYGIVRLFV